MLHFVQTGGIGVLNFNQRVQQFLKQHRENKKHAVIAVMLALMVAFSVCGSVPNAES